MRKLRLTVIIPTYNEEENIAGLLSRLVVQPDVEIIVSDGGSTDNTAGVCSRFPVTFIEGLPGRGRQLNEGASKAAGDVLLFLHADSIIEDRVFDDIPAAVKSGFRWGCCNLGFDRRGLAFKALAAASGIRTRLFSSCYGDQGIYCDRNLFFLAGGFPDIPFLEDICLSSKLRRYMSACLLPGRVITSARRFREGGFLKTLVKMQVIKMLFAFGVSAERLVKMYHPVYKEGLCDRQL